MVQKLWKLWVLVSFCMLVLGVPCTSNHCFWALLPLLPLVPQKGQGDGSMLFAGGRVSCCLVSNNLQQIGLQPFSPGTCWDFIATFVCCVSRGWAGVRVQPWA